MATPEQQAELRALIAPGQSVWERLSHLRRAWSMVRALTPKERKQLALEVGFAQGSSVLDDLVEAHPEKAPPKEVIHALAQADLEDVRRFAEELRADTPEQLEQLEQLEQRRATVESAVDAVAKSVVAPRRPSTPPPLPPRVAPRAKEPRVVPSVPEPSPTVPILRTLPALPTTAIDIEPQAPIVPERASMERQFSPDKSAALHTEVTLSRITRAPLVLRFRILRAEGHSIATPGDARRVLRSFPDGWARRRAFLSLLASGVPLETNALDDLSNGVDRRWCLRALQRRETI